MVNSFEKMDIAQQNRNSLRSSRSVLAGLAISAGTEVLKDAAIAYRFGTSAYADAYFAAVAAPWILATVVWSAMNVALVPIFSNSNQNHYRARALALRLVPYFTLGMLLLIAPLEIAAPGVLRVLAPGFSGSLARLTALMFRILLPIVIFAAIGGVGLAYLNSRGSFFFPAINNALRNIVIIGVIAFPLGLFGMWVLPVAVVAGVAVQNLLAWFPTLTQAGEKATCTPPGGDQVRAAVRQTIVPFLGLTANNCITIVEQAFATLLPPGSVAVLNFGSRIPQGLAGMLGSAFSIGGLPHLSVLAQAENRSGLRSAVRSSLRALILTALPLMVLLTVFSRSIVTVIYARGAIHPQDINQMAAVMAIYSVVLLAVGMHSVLLNVLYAFGQTKIAAGNLVATKVVNVTLAVILLKPMGLVGLGVASALAGYASVIWLLRFVSQKIGSVLDPSLLGFAVKVFFCSVSGALPAVTIAQRMKAQAMPGILTQEVGPVAFGCVIGAGVFLALSHILGLWRK